MSCSCERPLSGAKVWRRTQLAGVDAHYVAFWRDRVNDTGIGRWDVTEAERAEIRANLRRWDAAQRRGLAGVDTPSGAPAATIAVILGVGALFVLLGDKLMPDDQPRRRRR